MIECEKQGYKLLEYNSSKDIVIMNLDGYKYNTSVNSILNQSGHNVMQSNRYVIYNLNRRAELNSGGSFHVIERNYIDCKHKVLCHCDIHPDKEIYLTPPAIWHKNSICPECRQEARRKENLIKWRPKIKSFVEQKRCVFDHIDYVENNIMVFYTCPAHNERGVITNYWYKLKERNCICKFCSGKERTDSEFKEMVSELHPDIKVLGIYKDFEHRVKCVCSICDTEWEVRAGSLISKRLRGCPTCGREIIKNAQRKSREQFIKDLEAVNNNWVVEGEYINTHTPISVRCKIHNTVFSHRPCNLLNQSASCPMCSDGNWKTEKLVGDILQELGVKVHSQYTFPNCRGRRKALPFDYYLPEFNTAIEYDGEQHYYPVDFFGGKEGFARRKINDKIKDKYCLNNNIRLIRIPYYEKDNLKEYLVSQLNQNEVPAP